MPKENCEEASILDGIEILPAHNLIDVISFLNNETVILPKKNKFINLTEDTTYPLDFSEVKGQEVVKRALEVAASGGHNCLLIRPSWIWKNYASQKITYYFTKHEIRRGFGSYQNL